MQEETRKLDISVISDVHLATLASKAKYLLKYLKSIHPKMLVLNGDMIDSWRFSINYFPKAHLKVIRQLIKMIEKGVQVIYITGNHDDVFRKFNNTRLGNFSIVNQLELAIGNQKLWIFHGDVFDSIIHHSPMLSRLAAAAYGLISVINRMMNSIIKIFGGQDILLYKSMKDRISNDKKVLTNFELAIANAALSKEIDMVICGHTHMPVDKTITTEKGTIRYINCGDWLENYTAAECIEGNWTLNYFKSDLVEEPENPGDELYIPNKNQLYRSILEEMKVPYF